ncbi:transposable element Tc1 transposase [Trichonephila clavipes]|nr:transposable element Tc1 transposase [Trichonephila clavipes]
MEKKDKDDFAGDLTLGGNDGRRGRSHPPRCITGRDDRGIVYMAVMDRAATSQTVAQQIHSVSAHTIRCRLQQSETFTRRSLLRLRLTRNHRGLRSQWCDER